MEKTARKGHCNFKECPRAHTHTKLLKPSWTNAGRKLPNTKCKPVRLQVACAQGSRRPDSLAGLLHQGALMSLACTLQSRQVLDGRQELKRQKLLILTRPHICELLGLRVYIGPLQLRKGAQSHANIGGLGATYSTCTYTNGISFAHQWL